MSSSQYAVMDYHYEDDEEDEVTSPYHEDFDVIELNGDDYWDVYFEPVYSTYFESTESP